MKPIIAATAKNIHNTFIRPPKIKSPESFQGFFERLQHIKINGIIAFLYFFNFNCKKYNLFINLCQAFFFSFEILFNTLTRGRRKKHIKIFWKKQKLSLS